MSANATMTNDQANKQRDEIRSKNQARTTGNKSVDLGVSFGGVKDLFSSKLNNTDFESAKDTFNADTIPYDTSNLNPDFQEEVSLAYKKGENLYTEVTSQSDKPNTKGPQLKTIQIGSNGSPDTENSSLNLNSGSTIFRDRGFGVTEAPQAFPGRYNSRENVTLGDYITPAEE
jgi:hypothetical protein